MRKVRWQAPVGPGELVAVPVEPQRGECPRCRKQAHHGPAPGVVDPALGLVLEGAWGGGYEAGELGALLGQAVDHLQRRILPQDTARSRVAQGAGRWSPNGRHAKVVVDSAGTAPRRWRAGPRESSRGQAQRLRPSGRGRLERAGAVPGKGDGAVAGVGEGHGGGAEGAGPLAVPAEGSVSGDGGDSELGAEPVVIEWVAVHAMASMSRWPVAASPFDQRS